MRTARRIRQDTTRINDDRYTQLIAATCSDSASSLKQCPARILSMTRERWAQIGITIQFLIVVRTLGEIFRMRHVQGANFSGVIAMQYLGGDLIAVCSCWLGVSLYFFRRYTLSAWITLTTVAILLVYKIAVIGWR